MKISFLLTGPNGGGAERALINVANYVARCSEHEVDIVLGKQSHGPLRDLIDTRIEVVSLAAGRARRIPGPLNAYVRTAQPDVLVSGLLVLDVLSLTARALRGWPTKVLISVQNHPAVSARGAPVLSPERVWPLLIRLLYRRADCIVAASTGVAASVAKLLARPVAAVPVVPNPALAPGFAEAAATEPDHPWFHDGGPPVLLAAGRLTPQKDFGTLLSAFADLVRRCPARLIVIGDGEQRAQLEELARRLDVADRVAFPGYITNPYPWMRRSSLFVLSSRWEGFANVVAEALACGAPVVATECESGPAEILDGGKYGRLVPVGDPSRMATAMAEALAAPVDRDALVARGLEYGVEHIGPRYLEHIEATAAR